MQGFRFAMAPTPAQTRALESHCGAARFAYNAMLAVVKANLDQRAAERSYDIPDNELTPPTGWSAFGLQRDWNTRKDALAPWWGENSKHAYQTGCKNLARGLSNWAAKQAGFPKFKSKHRSTPSCAFSDAVRLTADRRHVVLPRIGPVRLHHSTRKLARRIEAGTARITGTTVSYRRGRWMVAFTVRLDRQVGQPTNVKVQHPVIGIDLGVRDLIVAATPDGVEVARVPAPRHLSVARQRLRTLQRKAARQQGPYDAATKTRQVPSTGWRKTQNQIARLHHRVANARDTHLHTVTAQLAKQHTVIGVETLTPRNMSRAGGTRKKGLNRALTNAAFAELNRQLNYKTTWYGTELVRADQWYPSSKTCSTCGTVKTKLSLTERTYRCDHCGLVLDRDLNAAVNLAKHAASTGPVAGLVTGGATHETPNLGQQAVKPEPTTHPDRVCGGSAVRKDRLVPQTSTTL